MTNCTLRDATLGNPRTEKTLANDTDALAPGVRTGVFLGTTFEFRVQTMTQKQTKIGGNA